MVHFDGSESRAIEGKIVKYKWDFDGDSRPDSIGKETQFSFASLGKHMVTLTVTDSNHYRDSKTKMVVIVEKGGE